MRIFLAAIASSFLCQMREFT